MHQPVYSTPCATATPFPNTALPISHPPEWPKWSDLVRKVDSRYTHSNQLPEIQACLSSAVQRANSKLIFTNGFPDLKTRGEWLSSTLKTELSRCQTESKIIQTINARAESDEQYFRSLCLMVSPISYITHACILTSCSR